MSTRKPSSGDKVGLKKETQAAIFGKKSPAARLPLKQGEKEQGDKGKKNKGIQGAPNLKKNPGAINAASRGPLPHEQQKHVEEKNKNKAASSFQEKPPADVVPEVEEWEKTVEQPEVKSVETGLVLEKKDPQAGMHTWTIENFSCVNEKKVYSDTFAYEGYNWRILIFPKGNKSSDNLSVYLTVADSDALPYGWSCCVRFSLSVLNPVTETLTITRESQHQFNARESDWGFKHFMTLADLRAKGHLFDDTVFIVANVRKIVDCSYDSACSVGLQKKEYHLKKGTCFVGLENRRRNCYMNIVLQSLYHIPYFRKLVYNIPENVASSGSISLSLQNLFHKLQESDGPVATTDFINSFGWDESEHQDAQEFNQLLLLKLRQELKGTDMERTVEELFGGHYTTYYCKDRNAEKTLIQTDFLDLQLDVKNCSDVCASFKEFMKVNLDIQDASSQILFDDFPPVLQLQLKRFEYDTKQCTASKLNDRHAFPLIIDLDHYLSKEAQRNIKNQYTLYSVLVHSGNVDVGHYYAFIQPNLSNQWYKFNDTTVEEVDKMVLEEHYGGNVESANAYMLVYVRESDKEKIMCTDGEDIVEHKWGFKHLDNRKRDAAGNDVLAKLDLSTDDPLFQIRVAQEVVDRILKLRMKAVLEPAVTVEVFLKMLNQDKEVFQQILDSKATFIKEALGENTLLREGTIPSLIETIIEETYQVLNNRVRIILARQPNSDATTELGGG